MKRSAPKRMKAPDSAKRFGDKYYTRHFRTDWYQVFDDLMQHMTLAAIAECCRVSAGSVKAHSVMQTLPSHHVGQAYLRLRDDLCGPE